MSISKNIIITSGIVIILWVIGVAARLPVIPFVETEYVIAGSDIPLSEGCPVTKTESEFTKLEIPNYFPENEQCIEFWFTSPKGKHVLTVITCSMTVRDITESEIKSLSSTLFWTGGSKEGAFEINDYELRAKGLSDKEGYVFFRTAYDVSDEPVFSITVNADYLVDGVQRKIDRVFVVEKRKRLTWHEFIFH